MKFLNRNQPKPQVNVAPKAPELHLDGRVLSASFEAMAMAAEKLGGIETIVDGLNGKSLLFQSTFADGFAISNEADFYSACSFMPTVRRRLQFALKIHGFSKVSKTVAELIDGVNAANVDLKIEQFISTLATHEKDRWIKDLAAEILHYRDPAGLPLMTRWVWDFHSNTGVLREIWFADTEFEPISVADGVVTHLELKRELFGFLRDCGVYANEHLMLDIFLAWIYSEYIGDQGGSFLRTDFTTTNIPFGYALRMLGLDAVITKGKSRLILPNGKRFQMENSYTTATQ